MAENKTIIIASRGSALALAQANMMLDQCRKLFPHYAFDLKIIKTTGDKLQTSSLSKMDASLPKGLFTKELEVALLDGRADLAVHSLKDLPTELPPGLTLGAVTEREDVRDVLIYRGSGSASTGRAFPDGTDIPRLPKGAMVATASTRRKSQLLASRPDVQVVDIRGNVLTRIQRLMDHPELDAIILATAGLNRLNYSIAPDGKLSGNNVPAGLMASVIPVDLMLPCVGQAALGIEIRQNDPLLEEVCRGLDHAVTHACTLAERSFLLSMGGGCQAPIGALATQSGDTVHLKVIVFRDGTPTKSGEISGPASAAQTLGVALADQILGRSKVS